LLPLEPGTLFSCELPFALIPVVRKIGPWRNKIKQMRILHESENSSQPEGSSLRRRILDCKLNMVLSITLIFSGLGEMDIAKEIIYCDRKYQALMTLEHVMVWRIVHQIMRRR
jgi:hypothetical protein